MINIIICLYTAITFNLQTEPARDCICKQDTLKFTYREFIQWHPKEYFMVNDSTIKVYFPEVREKQK